MQNLQPLFVLGPQSALSGTASETSILDVTPIYGTKTLPANFMKLGSAMRITVAGRVTADASPPASVTIRLKVGGVTYLSFGALGITANLENHWLMDGIVSITSVASNQAEAAGWMRSTDFSQFFQNHGNAKTFDETASNAIDVTAQFSGADAGTSINVDHAQCMVVVP